MKITKNSLINLMLLFSGCLVALVIAEVFLGFYFPQDTYSIWYPNVEFKKNIEEGLLPGIQGDKHFLVNADGMISEPASADSDYRILAIGGSTTECLMLGNDGSWPTLLQEKLSRDNPERKVWVGNIGRSGLNSEDHFLAVKHLIPQYPKVDAIIVLVGVNDFQKKLILQNEYKMEITPDLYRHAFHIYPKEHNQYFYQRTNIWVLLRRMKRLLNYWKFREQSHDNIEYFYIKRREVRMNAPRVHQLPDLTQAVSAYENSLRNIVLSAQEQGIRVVLMTQPTIWEKDFPEALQRFLVSGIIGNSSEGIPHYYSVGPMAEGMALYNNALIELCREMNVEYIDLASELPKDTTTFYDDMHFNESGASAVSEIIGEYFKQTGLAELDTRQ